MKKLILASTSTLYSEPYLAYLLPVLRQHFKAINTLLFIPYAQPGGISLDDYTQRVSESLGDLNIKVKGLHRFEDQKQAIEEAQAIFIGGGNTFLLLSQLYKRALLPTLSKVINNGTPYLGASAGTNLAGQTIMTTNDMPIVYPPSFDALALIPFVINPHYLDLIENLKHNGETRETRIKEYLSLNTIPVIGLREGSWLEVSASEIYLRGSLPARIFESLDHIHEKAPNTAF